MRRRPGAVHFLKRISAVAKYQVATVLLPIGAFLVRQPWSREVDWNQPDELRLYLVYISGDVEPNVHGPFAREKERMQRAAALYQHDPLSGFYALDLQLGEPEMYPFSHEELGRDSVEIGASQSKRGEAERTGVGASTNSR